MGEHIVRRIVAAIAATVLVVVPSLGAAASDAYQNDPSGLLAHLEQTRVYTSGTDTWEVWVCDVPDGSVDVTVGGVVSALESSIPSYFDWLSGHRYVPTFRVGGVVEAGRASEWPDTPFRRQFECEQKVRERSGGGSSGALIVLDVGYGGGYGGPGIPCWDTTACATTYPENDRSVVVGSWAVVDGGGAPARLRTAAHEIGHALAWPHSFGGLTSFPDGTVYEYDNPNDLMSGGNADSLDVATLVLNRYAAGWIGTDAMVFHRTGTRIVELTPAGRGGTEMIVLPDDAGRGVFEFLGARVYDRFDLGLGREGVEVYRVDQRVSSCDVPEHDACWGIERRTSLVPPDSSVTSVAHVLSVGESVTVRGVTVEVIERIGDRFTVRLSGSAVAERFTDDDGNIHEQAIEAIADAGITRGCTAPQEDLFCPGRPLTRAEAAVMVLRALGESGAEEPTASSFSDVDPTAWYAPAVERLAALGVVGGFPDGTFRPGASVSRAQIAAVLVRALDLPIADAQGVFTDVAASAWFSGAVEALWAEGVTGGCTVDGGSYCPFDRVRRDQLASFLFRAFLD